MHKRGKFYLDGVSNSQVQRGLHPGLGQGSGVMENSGAVLVAHTDQVQRMTNIVAGLKVHERTGHL
jgi:hypothetical protein